MKKITSLLLTLTALFMLSCKKDKSEMLKYDTVIAGKNASVGQVYTLNNAVSDNQVLVYNRAVDGTLSYAAGYSTGGTGTGGGLGSQGAVSISAEGYVLAVNPGSNSISSMRTSGNTLELISTVPSGGMRPISITSAGGLVYVLNAGGDGNISGFMLGTDGMLEPVANSTRSLSSNAAGPAQISFVNGGAAVAITEKAANLIITYSIANGVPGDLHSLASANNTPFGFAVGDNGMIYVSEAAGGMAGASTVSSYHIDLSGEISLVTGPISAGQTAACWVVITNNNKYVYATNTASNTISSFNARGTLSVLEAATGAGTNPIDAALNKSFKYLYVLNSGSHTISEFAVGNDGSLLLLQDMSGVPAGDVGLAAR